MFKSDTLTQAERTAALEKEENEKESVVIRIKLMYEKSESITMWISRHRKGLQFTRLIGTTEGELYLQCV